MNMPVRRLLAAAVVASLAGGFSTASLAAKTLRMSSQWTETTAGAQVDKWWAKEIEARTNGEIRIKIFWEGVLGKAKENLALIQNGSIDLAAMSPGYFPGRASVPLGAELDPDGDGEGRTGHGADGAAAHRGARVRRGSEAQTG